MLPSKYLLSHLCWHRKLHKETAHKINILSIRANVFRFFSWQAPWKSVVRKRFFFVTCTRAGRIPGADSVLERHQRQRVHWQWIKTVFERRRLFVFFANICENFMFAIKTIMKLPSNADNMRLTFDRFRPCRPQGWLIVKQTPRSGSDTKRRRAF